MTRDDVLKMFPDATDEQITNLLNQNNQEVAKERGKANQYKADADKAKDLQARIDELEAGNLSELEKANKSLETANNRIAELEKAQAVSTQKQNVMSKFKITAEQAEKVVKEDGSLDVDTLGQIISEKETAAATAKEQEILNNSGNPSGGKGGKDTEKTETEKIAENVGKSLAGTNEAAKAIVDSYL